MSDHLWYANPHFGLFCCLKKSSFPLPENQNKNSNSNFTCMFTVKDSWGKYKTGPGRRGLSLCWLAESWSFLVMFAFAVRWIFCSVVSFCRMAQPQQKEYEMFKLAYGWNARGLSSDTELSQQSPLCVGPQNKSCGGWCSQGLAVLPRCALCPSCLPQIECTSSTSAALSVGPDPRATTDLWHQAAWWSTGAEVLVVPWGSSDMAGCGKRLCRSLGQHYDVGLGLSTPISRLTALLV